MTITRYTPVAIALHWLMAALLIGLICVGVYMSDLPLSPEKLQIYSWHKWGGVTAFLLVLLRMGWRFGHPPPALPASLSPRTQFAAHVGHAALYLLMIAIPLSGWLMSSAKGFQTVYFGVLPIPDLLEKNKELGHQLKEIHGLLNGLLFLAVIGHAAAAIRHHFVDKDGMLWRMSFKAPPEAVAGQAVEDAK